MALLLAITTFFLNLLFPTVIGVQLEGRDIPVVSSSIVDGEFEVPADDNVFGMTEYFATTLYFAHDNKTGKIIKEIQLGDTIYELYSNGTKVKYHVIGIGVFTVENAAAMYEGFDSNTIFLQTCEGNDRLIVIARKR